MRVRSSPSGARTAADNLIVSAGRANGKSLRTVTWRVAAERVRVRKRAGRKARAETTPPERRHPAGWKGGILPPPRDTAAGSRRSSRLEGGAPVGFDHAFSAEGPG